MSSKYQHLKQLDCTDLGGKGFLGSPFLCGAFAVKLNEMSPDSAAPGSILRLMKTPRWPFCCNIFKAQMFLKREFDPREIWIVLLYRHALHHILQHSSSTRGLPDLFRPLALFSNPSTFNPTAVSVRADNSSQTKPSSFYILFTHLPFDLFTDETTVIPLQ